MGHAALLQHRHVLGCAGQLLRGAEHLQGAQAAAFVVGLLKFAMFTPAAQAIPAVFGQAHHALLVGGVTLGLAFVQ
jgi:hypothetical protein